MYEQAIVSMFWSGFFLGIIIFAINFVLIFVLGGSTRKTRKYRKELTDLYVAGKIRQIATEDKINLAEEYEIFKKFIKKKVMEEWDLDTTIEEELKEKITEKEKEIGEE